MSARRGPAPSISVVVPAYQAEDWLAEALDSVLGQSLPPAEVFVVDDGSTDRTAALAASFGSPVVLLRQPHAGAAAARNLGCAHAGGDLVAWLDADDVWDVDALRVLWEAAVEAGADGAYGALVHFSEPDVAERRHVPGAPVTAPASGTLLVARPALSAVGGFDTSLGLGEVIDWVARAGEHGLALAQVGQVVLRRRVHDRNTSLLRRDDRGDYAKLLRARLVRQRAAAGAAATASA